MIYKKHKLSRRGFLGRKFIIEGWYLFGFIPLYVREVL